MTTPEALTPLERQYLDGLANDEREAYAEEVAKLLRIHDQQAALIAELESDYGGPCPTCHRGYPTSERPR